jgi:hypothetical protein
VCPRADTSDVIKWRRGDRATTIDETVDVAARLHPYEELFNEAMAMAARFADDRGRRDRRNRHDIAADVVVPPVRTFRRRAS